MAILSFHTCNWPYKVIYQVHILTLSSYNSLQHLKDSLMHYIFVNKITMG